MEEKETTDDNSWKLLRRCEYAIPIPGWNLPVFLCAHDAATKGDNPCPECGVKRRTSPACDGIHAQWWCPVLAVGTRRERAKIRANKKIYEKIKEEER